MQSSTKSLTKKTIRANEKSKLMSVVFEGKAFLIVNTRQPCASKTLTGWRKVMPSISRGFAFVQLINDVAHIM